MTFLVLFNTSMKLLTKALLEQFQKVGSQNDNPDPIIICKFFCASFHWTWFASEYSEEDRLFFGFVDGDFPERGYFSLDEMEGFR